MLGNQKAVKWIGGMITGIFGARACGKQTTEMTRLHMTGAALALGLFGGCFGRGFETFVGDFVLIEPNTIVLASFVGDIRRSDDGGESWRMTASLPGAFFEPPLAAVLQLVEGKEGAIWARRPTFEPLQVSRDGGASFTSIPFGDGEFIAPFEFIARPGEDPLLLDPNGQLWTPSGDLSFTKIGSPNADRIAQTGVLCGGTIYAIATVYLNGNSDTHTKIWATTDFGLTWEVLREFDDIEFSELTCDGGTRLVLLPLLGNEVYALELSKGEWESISGVGDGLYYMTTLDARDGEVWVGGLGRSSAEGLLVRWTVDGTSTPYSSIGGTFPEHVEAGEDGVVWVSGDGLHRLNPGAAGFEPAWPR